MSIQAWPQPDAVTKVMQTCYSSIAAIGGADLHQPHPSEGEGFWRDFPAMGDTVQLDAVAAVLLAPAGERHLKFMLAFAVGRLRRGGAAAADLADAEDALQDFLATKARRVLQLYRHPAPFWRYFGICLGRHCLLFAKKLKNRGVRSSPERFVPVSLRPLPDLQADPAPPADAQLEGEEREAAIRKAVERLDPPYRDVMRLVLSDVDPATIAQLLSIEPGLVKVRQFRARQMLLADISLRIQVVGLDASDVPDFPALCSALLGVAGSLPLDVRDIVMRGADRKVSLSDSEKRALLRALEATIQTLQTKVRRLPGSRARARRAAVKSGSVSEEEQLFLAIMVDSLAPILERSK